MDDTGQMVKDDQSKEIPQDGSMYSESQNEHREQQTAIHPPDPDQQSQVDKNVHKSHEGFDSPGLSKKLMTTGPSEIMSQSSEPTKPASSITSAQSYSRLALIPFQGVPQGLNTEPVNVSSEKYESYHLQPNGRQEAVAASSSDVTSVGGSLSKNVIEPVGTARGPQVAGSEIPRSLSSMEVLYNTARNSFEAQPQKMISSMDVLYTAARASQIHVGSSNSVPGIDVLYKRTSNLTSIVPTSSVLHSTAEAVLCDMPTHQSSPVSRVDVTSSATAAEYGSSEASLLKPQNSYDNSAYEKYKHLVTQIDAPSSSGIIFPSNSVPSFSSEPHTSTVSSYYTPQSIPPSGGGSETVNRDGKQIAGIMEHNLHSSYYGTSQARDEAGEHQTGSLHSEANSLHLEKDYNRAIVSLPSMNTVPFVTAYDSYRSKVLTDENQLRAVGEYSSSDGNSSGQQNVSVASVVSEIGPAHYGYAMHHEKTSSSNLIHIPESHTRFAFHENGQIGLTHLFDSRKPDFIPRVPDQTTQTFYPRIPSHDSSMYVRSDLQKYHPQVYQDLMQGNHVTYYQSGNKTNLEQFSSAHNFGFHQSNYGSSTAESQHVSNAKTAYPRLDSLEKAMTTNSNKDVHVTNLDPHKSDNVSKENCFNDSLSSSKTEGHGVPSVSEHQVLYGGSSHVLEPIQHTESSSLTQQLSSSGEQYLQTNPYVITSGSNASPRSDMSAIKMKINAILESKSLQFDDAVQNGVTKNSKDIQPDDNLEKSLKEDQPEMSRKSLDESSEKELQRRHVTDGLVLDTTYGELNKPEPVFQSSESSIKTSSVCTAKGKKSKSKNVKRSQNNCKHSLTKKNSDVCNKENSVGVECDDRKLTTSDSLKNDQNVLKENVPIPQYKCDICQKEFTQLCSFQRHLRLHNGQSLFTCDLCGVGFNDLFSFVEHITEVGSEKLKQLKTIPELITLNQKPSSLPSSEFAKTKRFRKRRFRRSKRLKKNNNKVMKASDKKKEPEVQDVNDESNDPENDDQDEELDVEEDVKMEDGEELQMKNFKCNECGMQFSYARYLSAHLLTHSDQKSFRCEICSKEFSHGHSLNRHRKKAHPKAVIHSCNICGEGFSRLSDLKGHSSYHLADSSLKCKMCDQEFSCQRDLQQHVSSHTGGKAFQCDLCWKQFTQYCTLLRHKRRFDHTGGPPYKCKWCGEGFYEMGKLLSHSRKHMGSGPHKCDVCGKGFATTNNLKVHKSSVHSSEKPFCCDLCGDQFTRVSYLRQHIRTHTGDRPYVCELCGKGFGMQDTLSKHMRTHTGEKPYSCDQCGKQFSLTATLTVHKRTHTGERPYVCDVCGKGFIDNSSWNKHIKHHHKSSDGRETTLADKGAREVTQNNYSDAAAVLAGTCLTRMGDMIKERQLPLEGQFLTSQMSQ